MSKLRTIFKKKTSMVPDLQTSKILWNIALTFGFFFVKDQFLARKSGTLKKVNKRKLSHLFSSKQDSQSQSATRLPLFQYFSSDKNLSKLIKVIDVFLSRNHDHLKPQWRKILHLWNILDVIQWPTSNLGRKYDWGASKTTVSAAY